MAHYKPRLGSLESLFDYIAQPNIERGAVRRDTRETRIPIDTISSWRRSPIKDPTWRSRSGSNYHIGGHPIIKKPQLWHSSETDSRPLDDIVHREWLISWRYGFLAEKL
jgi:hypothetical protein